MKFSFGTAQRKTQGRPRAVASMAQKQAGADEKEVSCHSVAFASGNGSYGKKAARPLMFLNSMHCLVVLLLA